MPKEAQKNSRARGDESFDTLYAQMRRIAAIQMRGRTRSQTLQPTALVHEAYLRLSQGDTEFRDRQHFLRTAAKAMRAVLVDFARRRHARKRGGGRARLTLRDVIHGSGEGIDEVLAVHEALEVLARIDERQARVVELRYFGALSIQETAEAMDLSPTSVKRLWNLARVWLRRQS